MEIPQAALEAFCRKWKVSELALFGSVLRDDFGPESDVDVLITFLPETTHSFFNMVEMQSELQKIFGRNVDLVSKKAVEASQNYIRRKHILSSFQVLYAA